MFGSWAVNAPLNDVIPALAAPEHPCEEFFGHRSTGQQNTMTHYMYTQTLNNPYRAGPYTLKNHVVNTPHIKP